MDVPPHDFHILHRSPPPNWPQSSTTSSDLMLLGTLDGNTGSLAAAVHDVPDVDERLPLGKLRVEPVPTGFLRISLPIPTVVAVTPIALTSLAQSSPTGWC